MKNQLIFTFVLLFWAFRLYSTEVTITPTGTNDDSQLIQSALDGLANGDTLILNGNFVQGRTIYLGSDFTWILKGSITLAADANLDLAGYFDSYIDARRRTGITEKTGGATNIDMSGGIYYGNSAHYPKSMRYINFGRVTNSRFYDMNITEVTDDNFTLGPGCNNNVCMNLIGSFAMGGNAMTDKGDHNMWIDCVASNCGSDGWTPKCQYSTFIRCIAADNVGPGFGIYAREEGYPNNQDVGDSIIGNKFIDCVSYGSANSSGFSFNISSNCPAAIIKDNFIQAVCYNNQGSGVFFRNKDEAELGIIENNVVDIVCYENKGLKSYGDISTMAGGLGMENDNSSSHNLIKNITGSVVCYGNRIDVNTTGGNNCIIKVYHPESENIPVLDNNSSNNNTVTVHDFKCSDQLKAWCQYEYCGAQIPPLPPPPTALSADVVSSSQINLSWTPVFENTEGFVIERKEGEFYIVIGRVSKDFSSYSDVDLAENTKYSYRIQAFNISGFSEYSNEVSIITEAPNSYLSQANTESMLTTYPNPFQSATRIEYKLTSNSRVILKVFDLNGREVAILVNEIQRPNHYSYIFNRQELSDGLYFCQISTENRMETMKIMLMR
ncbi:MAG: T9SS type A sorting domain-containing protein [Bacteroidales bacterium]|nr:T9SS type A sorting domain-containing protein [Bacteroidales bacterium]MCF8390430.1 T9SS type A sorting domain-containing protein [Bacteroidales bacterium]